MSRKGRKSDKTGRSEDNQYWTLSYSFAKSDAFRQLPGPALKVFMELRARYNGGNNGKITLSLDEASRLLGLSKTTAKRAFKTLEDRGFIKHRVKGKWFGRKASEWILTVCSLGGLPGTNDWKNWQAPKKLREAKKSIARYPNGVPACFDDAA